MKLNLKKPLVFFDLETTGMKVSTDRIVEYSFIKVFADGTEQVRTQRLHPEMKIPTESSMVHGIYDQDIKNAPTFKSIAKELESFIGDSDLAGYNLLMFDIPVLVEEFLRAGIEFEIDGRHIVDAQKIFYMMEPRTLTGAYKYFCGKELEGAHGAEADTRATYEVLKGQIAMYQGTTITDKTGKKIEPVKNNVEHLHQHTMSNIADLAGRITFNDQGVEVFNFGKFRGQSVEEVLKKERGYYDWMMNGDFPMNTKKVLTKIKLRSAKLFS